MPGTKFYIGIWLGLVAATILEVVTRMLPGAISWIVTIIVLIDCTKAVAIALYYQHLRYEGIRLAALPTAAVVGVIFLAVSAVIVGMNMM
jgi:caa(3)-type oxidase subunit IV